MTRVTRHAYKPFGMDNYPGCACAHYFEPDGLCVIHSIGCSNAAAAEPNTTDARASGEGMINEICGRRLPSNYLVEPRVPLRDVVVRRGNGDVLAVFLEDGPRLGGGLGYRISPGWRLADVVRTLDEDLAAERLTRLDTEAHKRMRAAALNRRRNLLLARRANP